MSNHDDTKFPHSNTNSPATQWQVKTSQQHAQPSHVTSHGPLGSNAYLSPHGYQPQDYAQAQLSYGFGPIDTGMPQRSGPGPNAPLAHVIGYLPSSCTAGTIFTVRFSSTENLLDVKWRLAISFEWVRCPGNLSFAYHGENGHVYALRCQVPLIDHAHMAPVAAYLTIENTSNYAWSQLPIGQIFYSHPCGANYTHDYRPSYPEATTYPRWQSYQQMPESFVTTAPPTASYYQPHPYEGHQRYWPMFAHGPPAMATAPTSAPSYPPRGGLQAQPGHTPRPEARRASPSVHRRRTPGTERHRVSKGYSRTPERTTSRHRPRTVTPGPGHPSLVRTSTLPKPKMPRSNVQLKPYNQYSHEKAEIRLEGDLTAMTTDWTPEERSAKRRLIFFERNQENSVLNVSFKPVATEAQKREGIVISCIWWEEQNETYITSVDSIYLVEQLVDACFGVEEKNRIRRNLEGFGPRTISKADKEQDELQKSAQEISNDEFFQVIMGFADPKPRNIEKDIKVFPWSILPAALKKILSKFSASYASEIDPDEGTISSSEEADDDASDSSSPSNAGPATTKRSSAEPNRSTPAFRRSRPPLRVKTSPTEATSFSAPPSLSITGPDASSFQSTPGSLELAPPGSGRSMLSDRGSSYHTSELSFDSDPVLAASPSSPDCSFRRQPMQDFEAHSLQHSFDGGAFETHGADAHPFDGHAFHRRPSLWYL